jgi:glycosyltransferase involved in cell wall biosynthesis
MPPEPVAEPAVCILVATCDGADFVDAQLQSLRAQTEADWIALVSDDASVDNTLQIVLRHAAEDPRIVVLDAHARRQGIRANFARLMAAALAQGAPLFALCDQDDLWDPEKIARLRAALGAEAEEASAAPALAYADLRLVGEQGALLAASHFEHAGARNVKAGIGPWLLAHNLIPGCTLLGNRALLELAHPIPPGVFHHDWWILLVAAAAGRVVAVDGVLTSYRQHRANAIGAAGSRLRSLRFFRAFPSQLRAARRQYAFAVVQAEALIELARSRPLCFTQAVWLDRAQAVHDGLGASNPVRRVCAALCGPVSRLGFARNVLFVAIALLPLERAVVRRS